MNVWIINQYAYAPDHCTGTRHWSLARRLVELGHQVTVVSSSFFHSARRETRLRPGELYCRETVDGVTFLWLRTPPYAGNSLARLRNMLTYAWRVWCRYGLTDEPRPDVVVGSSPQLFAAWSAQQLARHYGVPFVLEIRDLWPETFVSLGHMPSWHPLVQVFGYIERHLYRTSDRILSLLPGAADYIVKHGGTADKLAWLPNGIDLALVPPPTRAPQNDKFTLMFAGSHGAANGLDQLLDAAKLIQGRPIGDRIRIRLLGDGPEKSRLQRRATNEGIGIVEFLPPVTKHEVYHVLAAADACLMLLEDSAVFRWGISPNKLFDYLACARPVLFSVSTDFNPIDQAQAGITVKPGNVRALADGIEQLAQLPIEERHAMGERGRAYVEAHHNFSALGVRLEQLLVDTVGQHRTRTGPVSTRESLYVNYLKPLFDRTAAALGIVLCAALLVAIALMVRIKCGPQILFTQVRPGRNGRPFRVYKFRTMTDVHDDRNQLLPDEKRLTPFGRWLRSTSLDELPELWNVVRGEMSLVGPRPLLMEYLARYTPEQARRHDVKPGITGLAQVSGRNAIAWNDKIDADLRYVDNICFWLDVKILWMTIGSVFRRQGISAASHATMPLFTGTEQDETSSQAMSA